MSSISTSFPWKRIEEKPDNFEDVVKLIDSALDIYEDASSNSSQFQENDFYLEMFLNKFPNVKEWFLDINFVEKKKAQSTKEMIIEANEKKQVEKDLNNFSLNNKSQINNQVFRYKVFNYLYILWWCHQLFSKRNQINPLVILDSIISINRINVSVVFQNPNYKKGFDHAGEIMNELVTENYFELLFLNPKLLLHCSFQVQDNQIGLRSQQKETLRLINSAIKNDKALLLGNQMPTGHGKTFLSVPLAKLLSMERNVEKKKCVLFACSNDLVNMDVASNALIGNQLHLWLAKFIFVEKKVKQRDNSVMIVKTPQVLLRPYKRCFPATWKKIYKKDDEQKTGSIAEQWKYYTNATRRIPDIIVADLSSCKLLLQSQSDIGDPFVAYIDEFVSDNASNKIMAEICHHLPKQTVLLSSILPRFENIPLIVQDFCVRHGSSNDECVHRIESAEVSIPCVIIDQNGLVRFPHHEIDSEKDLQQLLVEMRRNPRIRRTYSPKHVFYWASDLKDDIPSSLHFYKHFPTIGSINLKGILDYVINLLEYLEENFDKMEIFQRYRPQIMKKINLSKIFTSQSVFYEGKTLVITENAIEKTRKFSKKLFDSTKYVKIEKLVNDRDKRMKAFEKLKSNLDKKKNYRSDNKDKERTVNKGDTIEKQLQVQEEMADVCIRIPPEFVVNTLEHFQKFHPNTPTNALTSQQKQLILEEVYLDSFSDIDLYLLMAGVGMYDIHSQTEFQRNLVMRAYNDLSFFCSGLDVVYGTNLPSLVNIAIDHDFARNVSVATLYQLMGRVGREGRSYHANIIVNSEDTVRKLLCYDENIDHENDIQKIFQNA